ncbi:hypothetical protein H0H92_004037 [Tricholoma furcatifolium]|nr:hypothetical protein H0H92_004037 [Tricholoma furcatifolium]
MASHPVASSSHPAQIPALDSPHAQADNDKKLKEKKTKAVEALQPRPEFFDHCIKMFEELKAEQDAFIKAQPREEIMVTLPDGSEQKGTSWETSPMDIAKEVSKSLSER